MHRLTLVGLWILVVVSGARTQLPDYHVQLFDESFGMRLDLQNVLMDQKDFIWLSSSNRVFRFDGKKIIEFNFTEHVRSLQCDHHNTIWASTNAGVYKFKDDHLGFVPVDTDTSIHSNFGYMTLFPGKEIWLQTSKGFMEWQPAEQMFRMIDNASFGIPNSINTVALSRYNNTLFVSSRDSFYAIDIHNKNRLALPRISEQGGIYGISNYEMLVTSRGNTSSWCDFHKKEITQLGSDFGIGNEKKGFFFIEDVLPIDARRIMISSHDGVYELDRITRKFRHLLLYHEGKPFEYTTYYFGLAMDRNRNVWLANGNGLMRFSPEKEEIGLIRNQQEKKENAWQNNVRNFAKDEKGNMWLTTSHGFGYWNLTDNSVTMYRPRLAATDWLNQLSTRGLLYDNKKLFIGTTAGGVWIYDVSANRFLRPDYRGDEELKKAHEQDFIKQIIKLPNDDYLIVSRTCYLLDSRDLTLTHFDIDSLTRRQPNICYIDRQKSVWIGTEDGLIHFNSDLNLLGHWKVHRSIYSIHEYDDNRWFLGTEYGLFSASIDDDTILITQEKVVDPSTTVPFIIQDSSGIYWLGTSDGLIRYDAANKTSHLFDHTDNIQLTRFYSEPFMDDDGTLYIAGQSGINYFHPQRLTSVEDSLQVTIMSVKINDDDTSYYNRNQLLHLRPRQNSMEITFISPFYGNADRVKYRYWLEGSQESWQESGNSNTIRFSSLPPGHYIFHVAASTNGFDWFESTERIEFNIAPPYWQTWWFMILIALAVTVMVYSYLKNRIRTIRQKERFKHDYEKRIAEVEMHALRAQMNPHFMFNSLNSINNFILKNDPDNASGYLTKFSRLMRLILDNSRSEWVLLENELKALELYIELEVVRFDHVFEYEITVSPDIDVSTTTIPPMIIQPYVENAIWHGLLHRKAPGGKLLIHIWREKQILHVLIEDNGVGRDEARRLKSKTATKHKSHGMKITAERIEIVNRIYNVNAKVLIEDIAGQNGHVGGTRVSLTLEDKNHDGHHSG